MVGQFLEWKLENVSILRLLLDIFATFQSENGEIFQLFVLTGS